MSKMRGVLCAVLLAAVGCAPPWWWESPGTPAEPAGPGPYTPAGFGYSTIGLSSGIGPTVPANEDFDAGVVLDATMEVHASPYVEPLLRIEGSLIGVSADFPTARYEGLVLGGKVLVGVRGYIPLDPGADLYLGALAGWRWNSAELDFRDASVAAARDVRVRVDDNYALQGILGVQFYPDAHVRFGAEIRVELHEADMRVQEVDEFTHAVIPGAGVTLNNEEFHEVCLRLYAGFLF